MRLDANLWWMLTGCTHEISVDRSSPLASLWRVGWSSAFGWSLGQKAANSEPDPERVGLSFMERRIACNDCPTVPRVFLEETSLTLGNGNMKLQRRLRSLGMMILGKRTVDVCDTIEPVCDRNDIS